MSFSEEQARSLQSLADALKGTTVEEFFKAQLGHKDDKETSSKAALEDLKDINPQTPGVAALLYAHASNYVQRQPDLHRSSLIPSAQKMFYILNLMDTHLSDNFYARRAIPSMFPTLSRMYFANLWIYQILRVMDNESKLDTEDSTFLVQLKKNCPPEKMTIPGPLLPIFKSVCSSYPEHAFYKKILVTLPEAYPHISVGGVTQAQTTAQRFANTSGIDWLIPFPPYIAHYHHLLLQTTAGVEITLGANGSGTAANTKTATDVAIANLPARTVNLLPRLRNATMRNLFPFNTTRHGAHDADVPNATTAEQLTLRNVFGQDIQNFYNQTAGNAALPWNRAMTKLGLSEPILVHKDLITQFVDNEARSPMPDFPAASLQDDVESVAQAMMMDEDFSWFNKIAAEMSKYSTFFPESGTLADCSLEGPRTAQHVIQIQAPTTLPQFPRYMGDPRSTLKYANKLQTSVSKEDMLVETTARYSAININMYATHPFLGALNSNRTGSFWTAVPNFDNGTIDEGYAQSEQSIKDMILDRPDKIKK